MQVITIEKLKELVGQELPASDWFTVTQGQINQFADCTNDHQFIHVNEALAQQTPFGSTIAHGLLSLSMLPYFAEQFAYQVEGCKMGINYGFDRVRFIHPVKVNSRIRGRATLLSLEEKRPGQFVLKMDITVEIENESKPALKALWIVVQIVT